MKLSFEFAQVPVIKIANSFVVTRRHIDLPNGVVWGLFTAMVNTEIRRD